MDRYASAVWHGTLKEGKGTISTQSGTLKDTQYSFAARFADGVGTNPEELIAAARSGCYTGAGARSSPRPSILRASRPRPS
jgi:osmotically inducible protein OsmC